MREFKLPSIYPITDPYISGISHVEQVERLIDGGATLIQLRDKRASPRDFYNEATSAVLLAKRKGVSIIINDRVDIALALKADGVHLGQQDMPPEAARKVLGRDAIIGYSTHTADQVRNARSMPIEYIGFGPIFQTSTKDDPDAVVGLEGLRDICEIADGLPVVAIGGISPNKLPSVFATGADSAAMIGAILAKPETIASSLQDLLSVKDRY